MLVYPQLTTGALSQFPVLRKRNSRTVVNSTVDGTRVVYADTTGGTIQWRLTYTGLSDFELDALQAFHAAAEGSLNSFTFLDPAANLLSWSDDLTNAAWALAPLLNVTGGIADVNGGVSACHVSNTGAGPQSVVQTLSAPADYLYCFSVYVRSSQAGTVTLLSGTNRSSQPVGTTWSRIVLARPGNPGGSSIDFGIELPANSAIDLFGPQVEAQAAASRYMPSTTGGVYENARLLDDTFRFTTTDVNRHNTTLTVFYANHF
jgi:hypothetical protein